MNKTLIYTTFYAKNPNYESLIWEWLISLRTLGNYKDEVIIFDYGMSDELVKKLNNFSLGAPLIIKVTHPTISSTISNWRNIDVIPHLEKYKGYKFAHFDADIWFQEDVNLLWDELETTSGVYVGVEKNRTCRYRGPEGQFEYYSNVQKELNGFIFGGWIGGKYDSYLNKLNRMKQLWNTDWEIHEWGTDQSMITYLTDFSIDNLNGLKYGCSWYFCDVRDDGIYFEDKKAIGIHIIAFSMVGTDKEDEFAKYRFKNRYPELWKKHQ